MEYKIKKGLDIRLNGRADRAMKRVETGTYLIRPEDFRWLKPRVLTQPDDTVAVGTPLFCSKEDERLVIVSPVSGTVREIVRGERRAIEAIIIDAAPQACFVRQCDVPQPNDGNDIADLLLQNGLWPFLRQRPFSTIPNPDSRPKALFVSCFDSAPLAPETAILLNGRDEEFKKGINILHRMLGEGCPIHLCLKNGDDNTLYRSIESVSTHYFEGPHPAGNVGTQIHRIAPIDKGESVWYIHPQDVAAIGRFFLNGALSFEKTVAFTGPCLKSPCYYTMTYGADIHSILDAEATCDNTRRISGNILTGKKIDQYQVLRFYDTQVTVIEEGGQREFIGWLLPGFNKWSISHTFMAWLRRRKAFALDTSLHGGRRTFVMTDVYEKVFPFEILPTELLKACLVNDIEQMEELGIYEVDDEDFALCEVVCPSKTECQKIIREGLHHLKMELEGN